MNHVEVKENHVPGRKDTLGHTSNASITVAAAASAIPQPSKGKESRENRVTVAKATAGGGVDFNDDERSTTAMTGAKMVPGNETV